MSKTWSSFITVAILFTSLQSTAEVQYDDSVLNNPDYYRIDSVQVSEGAPYGIAGVTDVPKGIGSELCSASNFQTVNFNPMASIAGIDIATIINIGKQLWEIVKAGKPSLSIETDAATAIPQGLRCWTDLANYKAPRAEVRTVSLTNKLGMTVGSFSYKVLWLPGGSYKGRGNYIGYATIIPANVQVKWGFTANAKVSAPTTFNIGSDRQPVAGMNLNMITRFESPLATTEFSQSFYIDADGKFQQL